jgi:hypothetical protein
MPWPAFQCGRWTFPEARSKKLLPEGFPKFAQHQRWSCLQEADRSHIIKYIPIGVSDEV